MSKLRIGLMLDQYTNPFWIAEIIRYLLSHERIEVALVILDATNGQTSTQRSLFRKLRSNRFLYNRYVQWDAKRVANALAEYPEHDLTTDLSQVATLKITPQRSKHVDRISPADISKIRSAKLDILLRFGFRILKGEILEIAKYGTWSYHHGDNDEYRGGPAGFWEVAEHNLLSGAILQVLTEKLDGGWILGKCQISTDKTSPARNRLNIQLASIVLIRDAVERLLQLAPSTDQFRRSLVPSKVYTRRLYTAPTNREMIRFLMGQIILGIKRRYIHRPVNDHQWSIGMLTQDPNVHQTSRLHGVRWYSPKLGRFVADPFAIQRDGRTYIFVEEFLSEENRGRISVIEVEPSGDFTEPRVAIDSFIHRSFPFLFEEQGQIYLLPEQQAAGTVALYECVEFPYQWREARVLLNIKAVDSVLHHHNGKWWLFTTRSDYGNNMNNLHVYFANSSHDSFIAHPANPICTGMVGSRMAGAFFYHQGELIRPGQNCVDGYGSSVVFHRVIELTETNYREEQLGEMLPEENSSFGAKFHCINRAGAFYVVDGARPLAA